MEESMPRHNVLLYFIFYRNADYLPVGEYSSIAGIKYTFFYSYLLSCIELTAMCIPTYIQIVRVYDILPICLF